MDSIQQTFRRLNESGVEYILIGGMAAKSHGSTVNTEDIDICIFAADENFQRIVGAFMDVHPRYRMRPDKPLLTPDHPWLQLNLKNLYLNTDIGQLDILVEVPGVGDFNAIKDRTIEVDVGNGMKCRVLDIPTLIEAKRCANRLKDRQTIAQLQVILKHLNDSQQK
jgi:hypothetical protein